MFVLRVLVQGSPLSGMPPAGSMYLICSTSSTRDAANEGFDLLYGVHLRWNTSNTHLDAAGGTQREVWERLQQREFWKVSDWRYHGVNRLAENRFVQPVGSFAVWCLCGTAAPEEGVAA